MLKYIIAVIFFAFATIAQAKHPTPTPPEGGIAWLYLSSCSDESTKVRGVCHVGTDREGRTYVTFWVDDKLMFIRVVTGDTYEQIWTADTYDAI